MLNSKKFENYSKSLFSHLLSNEEMTINLSAEKTHFTRLSDAKVRQVTNLVQGFVSFNYIHDNKTLSYSISYKGNAGDLDLAIKELNQKRNWIKDLPDDPYLVRPENKGVSNDENLKDLPDAQLMLNEILENSQGVDLAGVFSTGDIVRASINSKGQFHWFKTRNFTLDYSLYNSKQKAVKSLFSGSVWSKDALIANLNDSRTKLELLGREQKNITKGEYRVYLAPSAVNELLGTLSWGGVSMSSHRQGTGSLMDLWKNKKTLSPKFSLKEDFSLGLSPRFNDQGEVSRTELSLIEKGTFKNFLTSTRTANEYSIESNFAVDGESLRSPSIATGDLKNEDILKTLGTGIYLSDLHYINWSDRESARVTGMTRYACFWVENGEIKAPINDLRFDESFYNIFGDKLEAITDFAAIIPATGTYEQRDLGGAKVPGLILSGFKFTL